MKTKRSGIAASAALALVGIAGAGVFAQQVAQKSRTAALVGPKAVITDKDAFLIGEPEMIFGPQASRVSISPDGRFIAATRMRVTMPSGEQLMAMAKTPGAMPNGEMSLIVWDVRENRAVTAWRRPMPIENPGDVSWFKGLSIGVVTLPVTTTLPDGTKKTVPTLHLLDAARGVVRPLAGMPMNASVSMFDQTPLALIEARSPDATRRVVQVLRPNGSISAPIPVPEVSMVAGAAPDGTGAYLLQITASGQKGVAPKQNWSFLSFQTGAITPMDKRPASVDRTFGKDGGESMAVRVTTGAGSLSQAAITQKVRPLWLETVEKSEKPSALIAADVDREEATLLPDASGAIYHAGGAVYFVPIRRVDRAAFLAMREAALKAQTVSNAKQIGLGLMMYAQDYDDAFPLKDGVSDTVMPYLKNADLFNDPLTGEPGFVFLLNGGSLGGIQNPAETQIGYLPGPGGRAIIFADGHVKWNIDGASK